MNRDRVLLGAAVLCCGLAVVLVLLARDVGRWESVIRTGDVAASQTGASRDVDETLPFSPSRRLLGLGDDVAFRRAVALFRTAYPRSDEFQRSTDGARARIRAETALTEAIRTSGDRRRASTASNLLGVLALVDSATAPAGNGAGDRSVLAFQDAVRLDPSNADAKTNLELLYQRSASTSSVRGRERLQRSAHAGASESEAGHGY
ncbi:MAG: hypothetical protein ACM3QU_06945 [Verrucomicrobiota bacterium]